MFFDKKIDIYVSTVIAPIHRFIFESRSLCSTKSSYPSSIHQLGQSPSLIARRISHQLVAILMPSRWRKTSLLVVHVYAEAEPTA
jgi:hypothetical protein